MQKRYWLYGGVIMLVIIILILGAYLFTFSSLLAKLMPFATFERSLCLYEGGQGIYDQYCPWKMDMSRFVYFAAINSISYIAAGALLGFLYGKIKNRKANQAV